jgi:hypothetical protein
MKKIFSRNKSIALLLFLFGYSNLFGYTPGATSAACNSQQRLTRDISNAHRSNICKNRTRTYDERLRDNHAFLYIKIPELGDEYLDYRNEDIEYGLDVQPRKERALPIYIELTGGALLLNPPKEDWEKYQVSSKIKERLISENTSITRKNCTFMALGSEYLFPIPAREGILSVMLYFDYANDVAKYSEFQKNSFYKNRIPAKYFDQFIHRGLQTPVNFENGKIYQIEILINPNSALPRGSYNATTLDSFETMNTVPGFIITLKELPPNTKFAFDGKDDVGKTYEELQKEFVTYQERKKYFFRQSKEDCTYDTFSDLVFNRCSE